MTKYTYCKEPFDLDNIHLPKGSIVLEQRAHKDHVFLWYLKPEEQSERGAKSKGFLTPRFGKDDLKALQWLWQNAPSKCGVEDEMECEEYDTCAQRRLVRKAFPFLEDMK